MPAGQIIGRISVKVLPDTDEFKARAKAELDKIERQLIVNVQVELDKSSLQQVKQDLIRWRDGINPLKISVRPELLAGTTTAIAARLRVLTRPREIELFPKLNNAAVASVVTSLTALAGARALGNIFENLFDRLMNLDKAVPVIGSLALAIMGLAGWGISAASNLAALSASLASMLPAALALPGIFTGLGIGAVITLLAFKDLKKVMPDVAKAFAAMREQVSADFWAKAAAPIRALAMTFLPHLASAAGNVGAFWGALAKALNTPFKSALGPMFDNLRKSVDTATGGVGVFASIITQLGLTGSQFLPRLAQWFVDISTRFDNFLKKAISDDSLNGWIESAIQAMKDLWTIVTQVFSILGGIARAATAAGGSTFSTLAATLTQIADVVNGPAFQAGLTGVFAAAHEAMDNLAQVSGPAVSKMFETLGKTLETVLPLVGTTLGVALDAIAKALANPALQQGLIAMFDGLFKAVMALAPAMAPIGAALGSLGSLIGTFAATLGPTLATAFSAASGAMVQLEPVLQTLLPRLGELLAAFVGDGGLASVLPLVIAGFTALATIVGNFAEFITPMAPGILAATAAWKAYTLAMDFKKWILALTTSDSAVKRWLATQTVAAGNAALAWIKSTAASAVAMAKYVGQCLLMAGQSAAAWAANAAKTVASLAVTAAGFVTQGAAMVASMIATAAGVVGAWVVMAAQSLFNAARMAASWLIAMGPIGIIIAIVIGLVALIIANWETIRNFTVAVFQAVMDWLGAAWDWIVSAVTNAVNLVQGIISAVFQFIVTVITTYVTLWQTIIFTVWNAIVLAVTTAVNWVRDVIAAVFAFIVAVIRTHVTMWETIISTVWNAILGTVEWAVNHVQAAIAGLSKIAATIRGYFDQARQWATDRLTALVDTVKSIPDRITSALGNLGNLLKDAGKKLIDGLIAGIESMIDKVKDKLSALTDLLPDWKGPASKDKTLLYDAGRLVIQGFLNGLESRYDVVKKSLAGLSSDVSGFIVEPPSIDGAKAAGLSAAVAAALNGTVSTDGPVVKVLNYNAAPGSSIDSEEDLFKAAARARMAGW